jgi:hypothetical protein
MTDLNPADQEEFDALLKAIDNSSKHPRQTFYDGKSHNSQINSIGTAVPETEASENEVEDPSAQDATTVDQKRVSAITKFILYSRDERTLHKQDQSFATHLKGSYRTQAIAAMADPNGSVFSELETEIENKVTTHIERSELGKRQVKTIFHAVTHPKTKTSCKGVHPDLSTLSGACNMSTKKRWRTTEPRSCGGELVKAAPSL